MATHSPTQQRRWRIIGAIAAKDIADGWRNRTLLGIALAVMVTLLSAQALPALLGLTDQQHVVIVADRQSELTARLAEHGALQISRRTSTPTAQSEVAASTGDVLGLVLPEEAEAHLLAGEPVTLQAFAPFAATDEQLAEARRLVTQAIREITGADASLTVETLYPGLKAGGRPVMVVTSLLIVALVPGLLIVPLLVMEEKESHTLDALLISPATAGEIVAGKALAGLVFGLIAAIISLIVFRGMIVHWGLVVAGMLLVVLFGVAIGLLLGTLFNDQATMNLWLGLLLLALIAPVGLRITPRLAHLGQAWWYPFIPSVALARLLQASMTNPLPLGDVVAAAVIAVVTVVALLALVAWALRRLQV